MFPKLVALLLGLSLVGSRSVFAQPAAASLPAVQPAADAAASAAQQTIPNWSGNGTTIKVCTSEYSPMVYCTDRDPDAYSGYEVQLFRKVALILGWDPSMLEWSCLEWDEMIGHLKAADGVCDIVVAGVEVEPELLDAGVVFTRPTYQNGLTVLVKSSQQTSGIWAFWDAFEWQLWVAALGTCVAVSLIVWAIDNFYFRFSVERFARDPLRVPTASEKAEDVELRYGHRFERYFWEVLNRPMMNRDLAAYTLAGNVIYTVTGFLILILFTLYLGNTSANLTILQLSTGGITGIDSLPGLAVGTWTDYTRKLEAKGVSPATFPWDSAADEETMINALKSGSIRALVLDTPLMEYLSATDCEVTAVGGSFDTNDVAVAFPAGFSDAKLVDKYNAALIALQDSGEDEALVDAYITPPQSECGELYSTAVTLKQVAGLWILLGVSIGAALAWLLIVKLWENARGHRAGATKLQEEGGKAVVVEDVKAPGTDSDDAQ